MKSKIAVRKTIPISTEQAASILGIGSDTLIKYAREGRVEHTVKEGARITYLFDLKYISKLDWNRDIRMPYLKERPRRITSKRNF